MGISVLGLLSFLLLCAPNEDRSISIQSILALGPVSRGGRAPVFIDPIEEQMVRGNWKPPQEGEEVSLPWGGGSRNWAELRSDENGWFSDPSLRGGYAFFEIPSDTDTVQLLDARGHRHVYVNGTPRVGDVYDLGITRLPIRIRRGSNELLFKCGRGRLKATLAPPPADLFLESRDVTVPDVIRGEGEPLFAGIIITNATTEWKRGLAITATLESAPRQRTDLPPLAPLSSRKVAIRVQPPSRPKQEKLDLGLALGTGVAPPLHRIDLELQVRDPEDKHKRTFLSRIDGSVQYYAVTPARPEKGVEDSPAMFLSLHGAGVGGTGQAASYGHKSWGHVVAPTNRRDFGFDWEDWGRLDALEVLALAEAKLGTDPRRTYLTGHSMGGHGTWNIGLLFPDRFAAIAPSAGWRDFWSYGGAASWENPTPVQQMMERATNASRTLLMERNARYGGVYVLHGDRDDNVPVEQARYMRKRLAEFHTNWAYYERPGAGHWWGAACMDWPPLFEFLKQNVLPEPHTLPHLEFTTVNPGISSRCFWLVIESQVHSMTPSQIDVEIESEGRKIVARTENVAGFRVDLASFTRQESGPIGVSIDDQTLGEIASDEGQPLRFARSEDGSWTIRSGEASAIEKGPLRAGPFKDAFRNRVLLVYGTRGTREENAWAHDKARYDAETFWYRGNGGFQILPDSEFDPDLEPDRNVILYGNEKTNGAWSTLLSGCPIEVGNGFVRIGEKRLEGGDLACLFLYPRIGTEVNSVGVIAGTGITGMRLTHQLPYFVSGVGYPDWTVIGAEMCQEGSKGIRGAGFFSKDWSIREEDQAWRD